MPQYCEGLPILRFLQQQALAVITHLAQEKAAHIDKKIGKITLRDTASRWGSCAHNGNLSFSWRIVMAPPLVIDYLAAHEVAHLKEMNHGPNFWALCERLCPRSDEAKAWLKRHGTMLHAINFD